MSTFTNLKLLFYFLPIFYLPNDKLIVYIRIILFLSHSLVHSKQQDEEELLRRLLYIQNMVVYSIKMESYDLLLVKHQPYLECSFGIATLFLGR